MNMATGAGADSPEWKTRQELAACYRLVAHMGLEDLTYNHISARVPGEDALLVKPGDTLFREVTASSLLKFALDGTPLGGSTRRAPNAIQVLHALVMQARPDVHCVIHSHSVANVAVSIQKLGLMPISQHALTLYGKVVNHEFSGYEFDLAMAEPLIRDLASCTVVCKPGWSTLSVDVTMHPLSRLANARHRLATHRLATHRLAPATNCRSATERATGRARPCCPGDRIQRA